MNAILQAQSAYSPTSQSQLRTHRSAEYHAFSKIIQRLSAVQDDDPNTFASLAAAIHDNRALWIILASDVASSENALPDILRAQIFYLAEFTEQHSRKVLKGEGDVSALIDINKAVMRGLNAMPVPSEVKG